MNLLKVVGASEKPIGVNEIARQLGGVAACPGASETHTAVSCLLEQR